MDDIGAALVIVVIVLLALFGSFSLVDDMIGKKEKEVIEACENNGYWQHKQIRVLCSIEKQPE